MFHRTHDRSRVNGLLRGLVVIDRIRAGFREHCKTHGIEATAWDPRECSTAGLPRIPRNRGGSGLFLFQQGLNSIRLADWNPQALDKFPVIKEGRIGNRPHFNLAHLST